LIAKRMTSLIATRPVYETGGTLGPLPT